MHYGHTLSALNLEHVVSNTFSGKKEEEITIILSEFFMMEIEYFADFLP